MRLPAMVILVIGTATPVLAQDYVANEMACFQGAAAALDDHRSDPASVAAGVLSACAVEINRSDAIMATGRSRENQAYLRARMEPVRLKTATEIVLQGRARLAPR